MGIPRTDIMLNRVRQESDTADENSLSDFILTNYFNDAQRTIQKIIFSNDQLNNVFTTYTRISTVTNQVEYDLPINMYADNSIISVFLINSANEIGHRFSKNAFGEKAQAYSYSIRNKKIIFNHEPPDDVLVVYNYRYPLMSKRVAKVDSVSGQDITVSEVVAGFSTEDERVCIVDKYGQQIATNLYIDNFSDPTLTVEGDITSVTGGNFVVLGANSSSHTSMPEECETMLKTFVQRKILAHVNSKKLSNTNVFTKEEREDLAELFADKHSDIEYPMVVDYDYLDV